VSQQNITFSDFQIKTVEDTDPLSISDFYQLAFSNRDETLPHIYKWLYRLSHSCHTGTLLILYNDRVIGHLGIIPFEMDIAGEIHNTNCIVDLMILPEFRKYGTGILALEYLIKNSELIIGLRSNQKSLGILKRLGFIQSDQSYFHTFFIRPFHYPAFSRKLPVSIQNLLNWISFPFLYINYKRFSFLSSEYVSNIPVTESLSRFADALQEEHIREGKSSIHVLRDLKYLTWRILESPHKQKYRFIETDGFMAIIKLNKSYIDILSISGRSDFKAIRGFISGLSIWGGKNGYSYIRFYTSDKQLSRFLKRSLFSFVTNPSFLYYTGNSELMCKIRQSEWNLELMESDFEQFQ